MPHFIRIKTEFVGFHRYKDAPDAVAFLRSWHRHRFGVRLTLKVDHANRQLEFFQVKKAVDTFLGLEYAQRHFEKSCEQIAEHVCTHFGGHACEVDEDGENAGVYLAPATAPVAFYDPPQTADEQRQMVLKWLGVPGNKEKLLTDPIPDGNQ